ncbi:MAG TPA: ABC-2 transporter permease [Clostridium sp.]|jgi:ABC-type transport system involved in multi-copper enzyme maturation permease subunit|uniref:ABC-2 transporter permease n=1 Tax=Clostridium lapidicellarium TaxID=3240931 RepID=A0ABV4E085_9CLOT|nr:ABC-2 transporter permease [uncultured Clostridium sp.]NLU06818.1 ABC-2 transporter permease [Clostridiales bacterium]HBC97422.1 ABC-2 transporter permease [Clostridium sp.]
MWNLVLKDILIQKRTFIIIIIASMLLVTGFKNNISAFYSFLVPFTTYAFLTNSFYQDERAEKILNSLPINRINIVAAKYLAVFIFALISIAISFLLFIFAKYTGMVQLPRIINVEDITGGLIGALFLSCALFPLYFKYGYLKTRYVMLILFLGIFFIFIALAKIFGERAQHIFIYLDSIPDTTMKFAITAVCLIIFSLSFALSYKVYKNKDL